MGTGSGSGMRRSTVIETGMERERKRKRGWRRMKDRKIGTKIEAGTGRDGNWDGG